MVEHASQGVAISQDGINIYVNPKLEQILGYTREEMTNRPFVEFLHADDREKAMELHRKRLRGAEVPPFFALRAMDKEGTVKWMEISGVPIVWEGRRAVISFLSDITERKEAEEALRQSEEKFRSLFETSRDVVYLTTNEGKFVDMNRAAEDIFGYTREELLDINVKELYDNPLERERFRAAVAERGFVKDYEVTMVNKDGTAVECLITSTVRRDREGTVIGYQGTIRDITERKRMQTQLLQTEKLSSLGGILSGVAHELNNPLTSIIGNAQLLMRKEIGEEIKGKLEVIRKESIRSSKIIQGLLTFARKHKPERVKTNINDVLTECFRLREYELRVDNVNMKLDLADDIPEMSADPYQLQQVFINIINNAHDVLTTVGGGSLIIRSRLWGDTITIEFIDDGPGIPEDIKKYIFDPFFTTKDVGKGTGLGLSIAYGIVSEHGGRIHVESKPGRGARFSVELPLVIDPIKVQEPVMEMILHGRGKKALLVVEDEENLRDFVVEALSDEGYDVDASSSGETAIELIGKKRYDGIITDMKMPGISGKELYTFIQKHHPDLSDRIIFITGDVLGRDTQSFLKITGNRYVEKPFEISGLLVVIQEVLVDTPPV